MMEHSRTCTVTCNECERREDFTLVCHREFDDETCDFLLDGALAEAGWKPYGPPIGDVCPDCSAPVPHPTITTTQGDQP